MMRKIYLLDCTLRDGGYVNDWHFGEENIRDFAKKIAKTNIEILEVGFIKGDTYDPDCSLFPDTDSVKNVIQPKSPHLRYVAMMDMSAPVPLDRLAPYDGTSVDGIRVIFKKDRIDQAYEYCKKIQELGYFISVNLVCTDMYSDAELIQVIEKFNTLHPFAMSIVDTFGVIKRKHFLRLVYLADHNLADGIVLGYHAHNNLQQAFGNAEAFVEMNLKRDIIVDACVFGMGKGAGNLNLELFAEYMNENYDTNYQIEPMLEIMDEYLNEIYKTKFWGYSLPLYLSATVGCHTNYAVYFAEKDSLTVKAFHELLQTILPQDKAFFSREKAERYYRKYQEHYIDDSGTLDMLSEALNRKNILILAPGSSIGKYEQTVREQCIVPDTVVIAVNFCADDFHPDYIFSSNMRRFVKIQGKTAAKCITTSNMPEDVQSDYVVNFASYASKKSEIMDNAGLMLIKLLISLGIKEAKIAGMDGYSTHFDNDYYNDQLSFDFSAQAETRNQLISEELMKLKKKIRLQFITPTRYQS